MKKILIFGCSFSAGSYELLSSDNELYVKNRKTDIIIKDSKGWYHFVDYFNDKDVTVIVCPGQGYWSWYQLLLMMDATNQLNFDEIWIQETYEPRVTLLNMKMAKLEWDHPDNKSIIDKIKLHFVDNPDRQTTRLSDAHNLNIEHLSMLLHTQQNSAVDIKYRFQDAHIKSNILNSDYVFFQNITPKIAELFQELCIKRNINGYVWSMAHPIMNCTKFTRLLGYVQIELSKNNLLCGYQGHQTEEGNKYIGELINKACIDMKI